MMDSPEANSNVNLASIAYNLGHTKWRLDMHAFSRHVPDLDVFPYVEMNVRSFHHLQELDGS